MFGGTKWVSWLPGFVYTAYTVILDMSRSVALLHGTGLKSQKQYDETEVPRAFLLAQTTVLKF